MKNVILDAIGTASIVLGTLIILFAVGGADCGDFSIGRALLQFGIGAFIVAGGMLCNLVSRKEGN